MLKTTTLSFLLLAAAAAPTLAQGPEDPGAKGGAAKDFVLETGPIEIAQLIDRSASFLGWNILVTPQELAHCPDQFKLQNRIAVNRDGCEELLTTMLSTRGFVVRTLDEGKNLYEVVSLNGPRGRECMTSAPQRSAEEILARPNLRVPVSTVLQMKHINAVIAVNSLRPYFASSTGNPGGNLTFGSSGSQSSLMITGMQDQVATAIRMLRESDVEQPMQNNHGGPGQGPYAALQKRIAKLEKELAELTKSLKKEK